MPTIATVVIISSIILLLAWTIWRFFHSRRWPTLILGVAGIAIYIVLLRFLFGFPTFASGEAKGPQDQTFLALALAMYVCMLAGMGAEYLYHYFDSVREESRKFDLGALLKPVLVSPLVFMPLAASLQNANLEMSRFDALRLMVFLVAFENGFLWRSYFMRKMSESQKAAQKPKRTEK